MSREMIIWQAGYISGFKLTPYDKTLYSNVLGLYEGKQVEFCIREIVKKASPQTYGYYHGILIPYLCSNVESFRGWLEKDIHNHFRKLFLQEVKELKFGDTIIIVVEPGSTRGASQKRMNLFIDNIKQWLFEQQITGIPEPIKQL